MLSLLLLVIGAILVWLAVTGRVEQFWKALSNPQGISA